MQSPFSWFRYPLQSKFLTLVVCNVILVLGLTLWVVNRRFTEQFQQQGHQSLSTAQAVFENSLKIQQEHFRMRCLNAAESVPVRQTVAQGDRKTAEALLESLLDELECDVIAASFLSGETAWQMRDLGHLAEVFDPVVERSVKEAIDGDSSWKTLPLGGRVFSIGSLPVTLSDTLYGAITFARVIEEAAAQELKQMTRTEVVLVVGGQVSVSTLKKAEHFPRILSLFDDEKTATSNSSPHSVEIGEEHFLALSGRFDSPSSDSHFGYVLLNSYENALYNLRTTKQRLLLVSLAGMFVSLVAVWILVNRIMSPLHSLQDGLVALERDDLSHRIEVTSQDEIGDLARQFNVMVQNLALSRENLAEANKKLVETSRQAGMAEIATGVLHNVGNVLNSVNVAASLVANSLRSSRLAHLNGVAKLLSENEARMGDFLANDPAGKRIPGFIQRLAVHLTEERDKYLSELSNLQRSLNHIRDIIGTQQSYARVAGAVEMVSLEELAEDAISLHAPSLERHEIQLVRHYHQVPQIFADRHRLLQIITNLIKNAKQAVTSAEADQPQIIISITKPTEDHLRLSVADNGIGIAHENMTKIFRHGFTTKKTGHGFGLHSGVLAARQMGGNLTFHSDGVGQGATFNIDLPMNAKSKASDGEDVGRVAVQK